MAWKQKGTLVLGCTPEHEILTWNTRYINKERQIYTEIIANNLLWCIRILCSNFASQNMEWEEAMRRAHSREPWQTDSKTKPESKHCHIPSQAVTGWQDILSSWPSSWHPRGLSYEKNRQTNWNSRTLYKLPNPSKGYQSWSSSSDKLRTNYAQEGMATKTSRGVPESKAQEFKVRLKSKGPWAGEEPWNMLD